MIKKNLSKISCKYCGKGMAECVIVINKKQVGSCIEHLNENLEYTYRTREVQGTK